MELQGNEEINERGRNPLDRLLDATKFQVIYFGLVWTAEKKHIHVHIQK